MKRNVVVVGLQRSGTTFIEELLLQNTKGIEIVNTPQTGFHKHLYGAEVIPPIVEQKIFTILVYKHPYSWINSVYRKKVDISKVYPSIITYPKGIDPGKIAALYSNFHCWWKSIVDCSIRYEHLIKTQANTKGFVQKVEEQLQVKSRKRWKDIVIPKEVNQSTPFTEYDRARYLFVGVDFRRFTWNTVKEINRELNHAVTDRLGYRLCKTPKEYHEWKKLNKGYIFL